MRNNNDRSKQQNHPPLKKIKRKYVIPAAAFAEDNDEDETSFAISKLVQSMKDWLRQKKFRTQDFGFNGGGGVLIQIEKIGRLEKLTSIGTALNVLFYYHNNNIREGGGGGAYDHNGSRLLCVDIGEGRWKDKVLGLSLGVLCASPVMFLTSSMGIIEQSRLPRHIFKFIEDYLFNSCKFKGHYYQIQNLSSNVRGGSDGYYATISAFVDDEDEDDYECKSNDENDHIKSSNINECKQYINNSSVRGKIGSAPNTTSTIVRKSVVSSNTTKTIDMLERLGILRMKGMLTEEEFQSQKALVLRRSQRN